MSFGKLYNNNQIIFLLIILKSFNFISSFVVLNKINKETRKKFFQCLHVYSFNSMFISSGGAILIAFYFIVNKEIYRLNALEMYTNHVFPFIYIFINLPLWTASYTLDSLLSIYITYERILIVMNKHGFLRTLSVIFKKINSSYIMFYFFSFLYEGLQGFCCPSDHLYNH